MERVRINLDNGWKKGELVRVKTLDYLKESVSSTGALHVPQDERTAYYEYANMFAIVSDVDDGRVSTGERVCYYMLDLCEYDGASLYWDRNELCKEGVSELINDAIAQIILRSGNIRQAANGIYRGRIGSLVDITAIEILNRVKEAYLREELPIEEVIYGMRHTPVLREEVPW
jgi:hypothetical protein